MSSQLEKLSILLPVRNEVDNLKVMIPILETNIEVPHELLVIYDAPEDNSIEAVKSLQQKYSNIILVFNDFGRGVANAVRKGISMASGNILLIVAVDEQFPPRIINDMLRLIDEGCDFVSTTRYVAGAKDIRSSLIEGVLSRLANRLFRLITGSVLSDATNGIKMIKKSAFDKITIEVNQIGWAFAFEISIKAQLLGLRVGEVPIVSIDRLFGGQSTFSVGPWVLAYMRWFVWGVKRLNRFNRIQKKVIRLKKSG